MNKESRLQIRFETGEMDEESICRDFRQTAENGKESVAATSYPEIPDNLFC
ncbi:MAG: hypothetical protein PHI34_08745 [Acidobacteriota bacterium]|nr:hypothetical protein [Acidobacteriota bacterium]